jgi:hypothetical protein
MQESEAKQKGCPLAFVASNKVTRPLNGDLNGNFVSVATINRNGGSFASGSKCIGRECMAWLWRDVDKTNGF